MRPPRCGRQRKVRRRRKCNEPHRQAHLVCGGRDFTDYPLLCKTLDGLLAASTLPPSDTVIIHGDANGADRLASQWAVDNGLKVEPYPADWAKQGRAAGPIRNKRMLEEGKPDLVVAFPGGRGTANMTKQAGEAGVPVMVIAADACPNT
jgi:hypothetical protein